MDSIHFQLDIIWDLCRKHMPMFIDRKEEKTLIHQILLSQILPPGVVGTSESMNVDELSEIAAVGTIIMLNEECGHLFRDVRKYPEASKDVIDECVLTIKRRVRDRQKAHIAARPISSNLLIGRKEAGEALRKLVIERNAAYAEYVFLVLKDYAEYILRPLPVLDKKDVALLEAVKKMNLVGAWAKGETAESVYLLMPDMYPDQGWEAKTWSKRIGELNRPLKKPDPDMLIRLKRLRPHLEKWPEILQSIENQQIE